MANKQTNRVRFNELPKGYIKEEFGNYEDVYTGKNLQEIARFFSFEDANEQKSQRTLNKIKDAAEMACMIAAIPQNKDVKPQTEAIRILEELVQLNKPRAYYIETLWGANFYSSIALAVLKMEIQNFAEENGELPDYQEPDYYPDDKGGLIPFWGPENQISKILSNESRHENSMQWLAARAKGALENFGNDPIFSQEAVLNWLLFVLREIWENYFPNEDQRPAEKTFINFVETCLKPITKNPPTFQALKSRLYRLLNPI